jgi:hypothetical protein
MALSQAVAAPIEEILGSVELAPRNGFHLEPRCRVWFPRTACARSAIRPSSPPSEW